MNILQNKTYLFLIGVAVGYLFINNLTSAPVVGSVYDKASKLI